MCLLYGATALGRKSAWWFSINEQLAGPVFQSAAPHPVYAGSADTTRKNEGTIAIRVGLRVFFPKQLLEETFDASA
jgi:hypothetical protein